MKRSFVLWAFAALSAIAACSGDGGAPASGPSLEVTLAPLDLAELTDVEVTLEVRAGATTVWRQERVAASRYGDGQGLTYVGPCDASASPNTVLLWIDDLYGPAWSRRGVRVEQRFGRRVVDLTPNPTPAPLALPTP